MKPSISFFTILLFGLLCAACVGEIEPSPTELPAAFTSPDFTSTSEPSATPTPTATVTPTPTPLPPVFVREGTPPIQPQEPISVDNASRIQELARWGYGAINEVEHSKDGHLMFVQTSMGVYAYHAGTLDEVWRYEVDDGASAFDVGSQYLAVGTYSGEIILLDALDGREVYAWKGHNEGVLDVALSPDETMVSSGSYDETMKLWQVDSVSETSLLFQIKMDERVAGVVFADGGRLVLVCKIAYINCAVADTGTGEILRRIGGSISVEHDIYMLDGKSRKISTDELIYLTNFFELEGESFAPLSDAITNDGKFLAVGGGGHDFDILLWDLEEESLLKKIKVTPIMSLSTRHLARPALRSGPGPYAIISLDFSPDDRYLLAANGFGNIFIWDLETGVLRTITKSGYRNVIFSPDGNRIISYNNGEIAVFVPSSGERLYSTSEGWYGENDYMENDKPELFFSPDGTMLANGSRIWNLENGARMQLPLGEKALGFNEDGDYIYTLQRQWDVIQRNTKELVLFKQVSLERPKNIERNTPISIFDWWEMYGWRIFKDENLVWALAYDTPAYAWDLDSGELEYPNGTHELKRFTYSNDRRYQVEFRDRDLIIVSELQVDGSYQEMFTIELTGGRTFYSDHILMIDTSDALVFYDLQRETQIDSFDMSDYSSASRWLLSPDGSLLVVATYWGEFHIWDLKRDALLVEIEADIANEYRVFRDLTFSPDGRYLATTSWDGTVRLWGIVP